ncbi:probable sucrose-phosphate synthase 5 [Phragmites australis]|uniref:probable sucrose-phosphate synthase 5 n=1 Tax=Phragmites australis TaxID=29695 RepID=UPI002D770AB9|nr:probable sucrose-phosphate synthase 5 [Phragmites australis]
MAAGNEWINGYLEAILDAGVKLRSQQAGTPLALPQLLPAPALAESAVAAAAYSPTRYFVEEVVSRFDDRDLHKTWTKVVAMRNSQERNNRLENLCWRIWHVARKKKQVEWEFSRQLERWRLEQELGSREAAEDLSEGEKDKPDGAGPAQPDQHQQSRFARINSDARIVSDEEEEEESKDGRNLYIVLVSIHGLVRGENMELGRDSDTGGQVKYVVELARALAATAGVHRVDLLTRQISCPDVDWTYGEPVEMITQPSDADAGSGGGGGSGAYIVRLPCGPRDKYLPKESLWPHIPEFVDRALAHVTNVARALGEQLGAPGAGDSGSAATQPVWPYVIHGHYADAAEVATHLASALNVPMVMTGHSLGRNKLEQLLKLGRMPRAEIQGTYKIARRIEAEETGLDAAEMVVTSTKQEIEEQWGLYHGFDPKVERKLRVRRRRGVSCLGRYMPRMVVIPPGMDFSYVDAQDLAEGDGDLQALISRDKAKKPLPPIWSEVLRFFTNPHKPMILALSRPDPKKNVTTLLKAYGESRHLRELANLTLILGNRDDIEEMSGGASTVLTAVLKLIDRYDLYGQVAYPKHHRQTDVPHIYRLAAKMKGVFINPALVEPFGLTLIEAAAYGLPVVATKNGGPVDIIKALHNGLLVDPHDAPAITDALLSLLADKARWLECRRNGLRNIHRFSWPHHCRLYLSHVAANCDHPAPHQLLRVPASPSSAAAADPSADESLSDSLRDLSLGISVDASHDLKAGDSAAAIMDALRRRRSTDRPASSNRAIGFAPGRRQSLLVVAVDCYLGDGQPDVEQLKKTIDMALSAGAATGGRVGYVLSTGMTIPEAVDALRACGVDPSGFDALICSSGAELCYPWKDLAADEEYSGHVAFRWPGEHVRAAVPRLGKADGAQEVDLAVDEAACSVHCHAYAAAGASKVKKIDSIRQSLRMRGFRCNLVYTRASRRLNVIPLSASRPRTLRYLSIQWGIDLSKVAVLVGDKGDTDRERLLPGLHKTLVLPGLVARGSEELLRDEDGFVTEDVVAMDSPNIVTLAEDQAPADILKAI